MVGLLPRLLALDTFLTSDEYRWLGRSRDFLVGVLSGDWAATLQTGHPGVTTMWTGSLGILYRYWTRPSSAPDDMLTFVQQVPHEPLDVAYVTPMRLPTVLLMSLFVVAFYALVSRLFDDRRVGAIAALLLALNPFHIALSRILHHDALATAFMTLSLLPLLGYWLQGWSRRWLLLSAMAAGLSFLSKSPAMFLMPFCALLGLTWAVRRWRRGEWRGWADVRRLVTDGLLWGAVAWLTVWLLWPAMWVIPLKVLGVVFGTGSQYVTEGHGKGNFFLGQITRDPGPLFYPLAWLLRTTPLTLLGLLVLGSIYLRRVFYRRPENRLPVRMRSGSLLIYAVLFVAFMTLGEKKQDRYILPTYPVLDALAALGLVRLSLARRQPALDGQARGRANLRSKIPALKSTVPALQFPLISLVIILLFQGIPVIANYPYYFTYYNPLLGGGPVAARLMTVGWGEGLDQAAAYLNSLQDAKRLRVTSWYHNSLAPFFQGETTFYSSDAGQTLSSDYAVVYLNQIQRELPTTELVHYLLQHQTPVFTATLKNLDYAYVYRLPITRRSNWQMSRLPGQATLFGISEASASSDSGSEGNAASLSLRLYWQNEGLAPGETWWIALQSMSGPVQSWQTCRLRPEFLDEQWVAGAVLESECYVTGEGLVPGIYHLLVGLGPDANQLTPLSFPEGEFAIALQNDVPPHLVSRLTAFDMLARDLLPREAQPADLVYQGAVRLIGYTLETSATAEGRYLQVHLYWQALQPLPLRELNQALTAKIALVATQGTELVAARGPFTDPETSPATWYAGQVLTGTLSLPLPEPVPSQTQLELDVSMNEQPVVPFNSIGETVEPTLPVFILQ